MNLLRLNQFAMLAALGLTACATTTTADSSPLTAEERLADEQAEAGLRDHHRHHHRGGVLQFVAMSLDTLGPSDAARPRVEALQRDLYVCMASTGEIQRALHQAVAEGVAAGAVDLAKVDGLIAQLDAAAAGVRGCSVEALGQLHAILSPDERAELVEKVQAHWEVWRQVNQEDTGDRSAGGRLAALAAELDLTVDQIERAAAALHTALPARSGRFDRTQVDADMQAFSTAFLSPSFDARATTLGERARLSSHGATRMAIFYETVTPLLTPAQRTVLAEHLRERAGHHPAVTTN
jgi:Spy/CpxP family protein refolding chaperone